jgi:hypothetical protein
VNCSRRQPSSSSTPTSRTRPSFRSSVSRRRRRRPSTRVLNRARPAPPAVIFTNAIFFAFAGWALIRGGRRACLCAHRRLVGSPLSRLRVARAETAKQRLRDEEKSRQSLNNLDKAAMEKCELAPHVLVHARTRSLSASPARRRLARRPGAKLEPSDSHSVPVRSDGQAVEMASYKVRGGGYEHASVRRGSQRWPPAEQAGRNGRCEPTGHHRTAAGKAAHGHCGQPRPAPLHGLRGHARSHPTAGAWTHLPTGRSARA